MEDNEKIFKEIDEGFLKFRTSKNVLNQRCHTFIDNVMESRFSICFNSDNREIGFPEIAFGGTTMKISGLSKILGAIHLISASTNEASQITIDAIDTFCLYSICCEIKDALKYESTSYFLNHNKEYLKDIKENDPEFVQDIIDAYDYYSNRLTNRTGRAVLDTFIIDGMTHKEANDLSNAKELPSGIMLPFNAHKNATTNHKFSWETMTFYITILEDRAYLSPFIKIVDYNKKDTNDVILKMENGELIAQ
jgi:hypothetical protein